MITQSSDGSNTAYSTFYGEHFHSLKDGAINETIYKHIHPAFTLQQNKTRLRILDICFGLGYNTFFTLWYVKTHNLDIEVEIYTPELDSELLDNLKEFDYPDLLSEYVESIQELIENRRVSRENWSIELFVGDAREYIKQFDDYFDIVYQDAFSPKKNSELWTYEYFVMLSKSMKNGGILTTYSKATSVKMGLWESGFDLFEIENQELDGLKSSLIASKNRVNCDALEKSGYQVKSIKKAEKLRNSPDAKPLFDKFL